METQNIMNLLNDSSNKESKFATKKCYVIDSQTAKDKYKQKASIKFETKSVMSSFLWLFWCIYFVAGYITVNTEDNDGNNRGVVFKNCALFSTCMTETNDVFIDEVNYIYISMPIYNLIE